MGKKVSKALEYTQVGQSEWIKCQRSCDLGLHEKEKPDKNQNIQKRKPIKCQDKNKVMVVLCWYSENYIL